MWKSLVDAAKDHGPWIIVAVALIWRGPNFIREYLSYRHKENEGKRRFNLQMKRFHASLGKRLKVPNTKGDRSGR